ncbi:MAG TPA: methyltransferase domain-containing protein [Acidimicrobiia bacterium]|nr:methyltransferase domain-containing protein [Acidimicrobiia bacterium]
MGVYSRDERAGDMSMTMANSEQAAAWDGDEGEHWTEFADYYDAAANAHWQAFLASEPVARGDRVLDVGCGTGLSTRDAARVASDGAALGIDLSAGMLALAAERSRAEGLENVEFVQGDAQVHRFAESAFDVAISRFGAMFFGDPDAAFRNIASAVRPGGDVALLAWRGLSENEWLREFRGALAAGRDLPAPPPGAPGPFGLADPDGVRRLLGDAGFEDVALTASNQPIWFGKDAEDAWSFVRHQGLVRGLTQDLDDATRARALDDLQQVLADHATADGVVFASAAWIINARRSS